MKTIGTIERLCLLTLLFSNTLFSQEVRYGCSDETQTYEEGSAYEADLDSVLVQLISGACSKLGEKYYHDGWFIEGEASSSLTDEDECLSCMAEADIRAKCPLKLSGWVEMDGCNVFYAPLPL